MKKILLIVSLFMFSFSLYSQDLPNVEYKSLKDKMPTDPNVKIGKLSNGIVYYIRANNKPEKRANLQIVVKAGSIEEDDDQKGLAHFIEHMCFNGTKHFPKNELVKYLEGTGMRFGADLNANTSFDRTYYLLQVPTDQDKTFEDGMQILQDWLRGVSFDQDELDKERRVILEEWRLYRGAQDRIMKQQFPKMLWGSRYVDRDVIGDTAVIMNAPRETFLRYYNDWYRPNLSAVILVGDFDVKEAEAKLIKYFEPLKNPENPREKKYYPMPEHADPKISVATDKELPYSMIQILYKRKAEEQGNFEYYRKGFVSQLMSVMLSMRYQELTRKANPPFMYAGGAYENMQISDLAAFALFTVPKTEDVMGGYKSLLEEAFRAYQHGFTATELERAKTTLLKSMETGYKEKDKTESENFADEYMRNFMFGEAIPGVAYEYAFMKKELPGITLNEVNTFVKEMLVNKNLFIGFSMPEKEGLVPPTEAEIMKVYSEVSSAKLEAYIDKATNEALVKKAPKAGTITSLKELKEAGATEWTLSNGAKVILKKTDFKNDELQFSAFSMGGTSLCKDADYLSASNASGIIANSGLGKFDENTLSKMLQGKIARVSPYITDLSEGLYGMTTPQDMETFFQLLYSYFKQPRKDSEAFQSFITSTKDMMANQGKDPSSVFGDTIQAVMGGYHLREIPTKMEDMDKINLDKAFEFYQERFADAGDFTFVFVGNYDDKIMEDMVKKYIASLPGKASNEKFVDHKIAAPKGKFTKIIKKGVDDKASVSMKFYNDFEYTPQNIFVLRSLIELFNIKLIEIVREEKSGVYGVGARPRMTKFPTPEYQISVGFGTEPKRVDELVSTIEDMMRDFQNNVPKEEDLLKVKEIQRKELERAAKENDYWVSILQNSYYNGLPLATVEQKLKMIDNLTAKDLQDAAKKYFTVKNYGKFILYPEK